MDFALSQPMIDALKRFKAFLKQTLDPFLTQWHQQGEVPRRFYHVMGQGGWLGFEFKNKKLLKLPALRGALIAEELAIRSPGVAVANLAIVDLGLSSLWLFGSPALIQKYAPAAVSGELLICLGNSEGTAGSDVAGIQMQARKVDDGWRLNGAKAFVTNGLISDLAVVTAVTDPAAARNRRLSMFLVDLKQDGVVRTKLNKQVWIPSDLTRLTFNDVWVPADHLLGEPGRGLTQVLGVFTHSRLPISALTLGTAVGAFNLAVARARKRKLFGKPMIDFQAKAFETADHYARMEAVRLMIQKTCWVVDQGRDFRLESSMAKYLAVETAQKISAWAADVFGAVSVVREHPIHKYPMDAWAASLGEGTQDVQKLIIFREMLKRLDADSIGGE